MVEVEGQERKIVPGRGWCGQRLCRQDSLESWGVGYKLSGSPLQDLPPAPHPHPSRCSKSPEPDEPLFYLGTILLFPFLSCALVLEAMWVWLPVGHLQAAPPPPTLPTP